MEWALYDETWGYYTDVAERSVGRSGDFYTSVSVGDVFGRLISHKIRNFSSDHFDQDKEVVIVEQGAHQGQLAADIVRELSAATEHEMSFRYRIIEARPGVRAAIEEFLTDHLTKRQISLVDIVATAAEAAAPQGIFLCNELLDAFPVRRFVRSGASWVEQSVGIDESSAEVPFRWVNSQDSPERFAEWLPEGDPQDWAEGYETEICPAISPWMRETSRLFKTGAFWVIDYGFTSEEYFAPSRKRGTLRAYRDHKMTEDVLSYPGEQDLTAHVNFTHLRREAEACGLSNYQLRDQHHVLIEAGREWLLGMEGRIPDRRVAKDLRQFKTLTHPSLMGRQFKWAEMTVGL